MTGFKEWIEECNFYESFVERIALCLAADNVVRFTNEAAEYEQHPSRSMLKDLRDSILWIRWHSMSDRRKNSEFLKSTLSQYGKPGFDWSRVIPVLEKMGYVNDPNASEDNLFKALQAASEEDGNNLPSDVSEKEVGENITKARQTFFSVLKNIFDDQYEKIAGNPNEKKGHIFFSDKDDLANKFMLRMYKNISERPKSNNEISSWKRLHSRGPELGRLGKNELEGESLLNDLMNTMKGWLKKELPKERLERRVFNSPSSSVHDDVTNRSKKRSIISTDLKRAIKIKSSKPLAFYLKYIDAHLSGKNIRPRTTEDSMRMEIMQDIERLKSRYPDLLSFNAEKITQTLHNYRDIFSAKKMPNPTFMGGATQPEEFNDEETTAKRTDKPNPIASGLASYNQNPELRIQNSESEDMIRKQARSMLHSAMNQLAVANPKWALALCVKFGLNCSNGTVNSVDNFSNAVIRMTKEGKAWGSKKTDCPSLLSSIGLRVEEVAEKISAILGQEQNQGTIYSWITKGLEFICKKMTRNELEPGF
jgi:hypothetical protein